MNLQAEEVLKVFNETGAYLRGHFRLTSGLHSPEYLQCALVLQHPRHAERLGQALADRLGEILAGARVDVVASPAIGGLIIGHEAASPRTSIFTEPFSAADQSAVRLPLSKVPGLSRLRSMVRSPSAACESASISSTCVRRCAPLS